MTLGNMIDACAEVVGTGGMIESAGVDSLGQLEKINCLPSYLYMLGQGLEDYKV